MDNLSFEECLKQLEEIVKKLENKDISLDESISLYKKGLELSKQCYEMFEKTKQEIKMVEGEEIKDLNK